MPQFANDKVENSPNAIALADPYHSYTWVETNEILNRCANNILESDLGEKRRVAVFAENAGETAFAHLGALLGGASSVPVNFHLTAEEAAYILEDSEAQILFVGPHTLERGLEAARQAGIQQVVGWKCDANSGLVDWAEWLKEGSPQNPPDEIKPLPNLLYTSGTTGRPKGTELPPTMFAGGNSMTEHIEGLKLSAFAEYGTHLVW